MKVHHITVPVVLLVIGTIFYALIFDISTFKKSINEKKNAPTGRQLLQKELNSQKKQGLHYRAINTDVHLLNEDHRQNKHSKSSNTIVAAQIAIRRLTSTTHSSLLSTISTPNPSPTTTTKLSQNVQPVMYNDVTNALERMRKDDHEYTDVLELIRSTNKTVIRLSAATEKNYKSTDRWRHVSKQKSQLRNDRYKTNYKSSAPFIPNVVHYVWFDENRTFTFLQYLSFLSASRYLNPDYIFIHGDNPPAHSVWWDRASVDIPNIYFVKIARRTTAPNGELLKHIEHAADVERIIITLTYGGIYLDTDILVVKSFDPLRYNHPMVMGRENRDQINSGIVMARRGEPFLSMWLECYRSYLGKNEGWAIKATMVPHELSTIYPHLIHVEEWSLNHPNWLQPEVKQLFEGHYDWSNNYAIHVWSRTEFSKIPQEPAQIDRLDTTLGEIMRQIYYGSQKLRIYLH